MRPSHLLLSTTLMACALALAAPAQARDHGRGQDRGDDRGWDRGHDRRDDRQDRRGDRRDDRQAYRQDWREDRRDDRRVRYVQPRAVYVVPPQPRHVVRYYDAPRGYYDGPRGGYYQPRGRGWAVGQPYHRVNYGPTYVVHDYRPYGLRQPPRGYYWRRSDAGDFLLVAVATGIIADLILHR